MGYSEIYCHICGVSFNIGRIRAPHEPRIAAWDGNGSRDEASFVDNSCTVECGEDAGCMRVYREDRATEIWNSEYAHRKQDDESLRKRLRLVEKAPEDDDDDFMDADYVPDIPSGDEQRDDSGSMDYEYETPSETCDEVEVSEDGDDMPIESSASDSEYREFEEAVRKPRVTLKAKFPDVYPDDPAAICRAEMSQTKSEDEVMLPLSRPRQDRDKDEHAESMYDSDDEIWEHIAGSGCVNINGYNGNRTSAEEMQGCNTSQALISKADVEGGWQPSARDEPWERACTFFLSGLNDSMPDREDWPTFFPERNGFGQITVENVIWDAGQYAMPFHPACLETYKRASLRRHETAEIEALTSWWQLTASYDEFDGRWTGAVSRGQDQWWNHTPGDEYLAANPCIVPKLKQILELARGTTPGTENASQLSQQLVKTSSFEALPAEIHRQIFGHLSIVDIARTCIAAECVRGLGQAYIRDRLLTECPHLWELWCDKPYSQWVGTTAREFKEAEEAVASEPRKAEHILGILKEEGQKEAQEAFGEYWSDTREDGENITHDELCLKKNYRSLAESSTDFVRLAIDLGSAVEQDQLKGLTNRERIWNECQRILAQIEDFKRQGKIRQDGTVPPGASLATR